VWLDSLIYNTGETLMTTAFLEKSLYHNYSNKTQAN